MNHQDELGLVDGQLAPHIGLPLAKKIATLAAAGKWEAATRLLAGNPTALRILARCRGVLE